MNATRANFHQLHKLFHFFTQLSTVDYVSAGHLAGNLRQRSFKRGSTNLFKANVLWDELSRIYRNRH